MNLVYGKIVDLIFEEGMRMGKIRVGGVMKKVPLDLLIGPARGDNVLLCDGVAISKVENENNKETHHVPRDTRKTH